MQNISPIPNSNESELNDGNRLGKPLRVMVAVMASIMLFTFCFGTTFRYVTPKFSKMFEIKPFPAAEQLNTVRALSYNGTELWDQSKLTKSVEARMMFLDDYYTDPKHPGHALYYDTQDKKIVCFTEKVQEILVPAGIMKSEDAINTIEYTQDIDKAIVEIVSQKGDRAAYYIDFSTKSYKKLPSNFSAATFTAVDKEYKKMVTVTARSDSEIYKNVLVTDISTGEVTNITMSGSKYTYNTAGVVTVSTDNRFLAMTIANLKNPETGKQEQVLYDLTNKTSQVIQGSVIHYALNDRYVIFTNNADQKTRIYDANKRAILRQGKWPKLPEYSYYKMEEASKILYRIDLRTGLKEAISDREVAAYQFSAKGQFVYFYLADLKKLILVDIGTLAYKDLTLPNEYMKEINTIPQTKLVVYSLFTENTGSDVLLTYYIDDYEWHNMNQGPSNNDSTGNSNTPSKPNGNDTSSNNTSSNVIDQSTIQKNPERAMSIMFNNASNLTELYQATSLYGVASKAYLGNGFSELDIKLTKGKLVVVEDYRSHNLVAYRYSSNVTHSAFTICRDYSATDYRQLLIKNVSDNTAAEKFKKAVGKAEAATLDYQQFYSGSNLDQVKINQWLFGTQETQLEFLKTAQHILCTDNVGRGTPMYNLSALPSILEVLNRQQYITPSRGERELFGLSGKDADTVYCQIRNSSSDVLLYFNYIKKGDNYIISTILGIAYVTKEDFDVLKTNCPVAGTTQDNQDNQDNPVASKTELMQ